MDELIKMIDKLCKKYLDFTETIGNECAYTDGIVEEIINRAMELKNKYDEEI